MQTKRYKPPHYEGGTKISSYQSESVNSTYETEFVWRGVRQSCYIGENQPVLHVTEVIYAN